MDPQQKIFDEINSRVPSAKGAGLGFSDTIPPPPPPPGGPSEALEELDPVAKARAIAAKLSILTSAGLTNRNSN